MAATQATVLNPAQAKPQKRLWSPVVMESADTFWIILITAMSATVIVTRVYLESAGYPQVGDSTFHVAHVLWGGLLMFIALVLPLSFANPYIPYATALLGGLGVGLFLDEVGKFITQKNDYFFPLAFPIIYAFVVICVWLVFRIRAHRPRDTRTLLYHALEELKQVLDNDLDPFERRTLRLELTNVLKTSTDPEERALAEALVTFINNRNLQLSADPMLVKQFWMRARREASIWPPRGAMRIVLIIGFALVALDGLLELVTFASLATQGGRAAVEAALGNAVIISGKSEYIVSNPQLATANYFFIIVVGVLSLLAAVLMLMGRERLGLRLGTASLVFSLLIVNLLAFYFNQLYAIVESLGQAVLLALTLLYRWRFFTTEPRAEKAVDSS